MGLLDHEKKNVNKMNIMLKLNIIIIALNRKIYIVLTIYSHIFKNYI